MAADEQASHSVKIETLDFEGPLDLLVYLVKKNEIDIYDIPIAEVTDQFLGYLDSLEQEKLEAAGEFLIMAATLLRIKAQMLLPRPDLGDDDDIEDPRRELVLKIIEYQQFKEIADHLRDQETSRQQEYSKGYREWIEQDESLPDQDDDPETRVSLTDLLRAFALIMEEAARDRRHHVEPLSVTIEEKVNFVRKHLREKGQATFKELFVAGEPRGYWIVTFVALLEMAREGEIRLRQGDTFGEIHVYHNEDTEKAEDSDE